MDDDGTREELLLLSVKPAAQARCGSTSPGQRRPLDRLHPLPGQVSPRRAVRADGGARAQAARVHAVRERARQPPAGRHALDRALHRVLPRGDRGHARVDGGARLPPRGPPKGHRRRSHRLCRVGGARPGRRGAPAHQGGDAHCRHRGRGRRLARREVWAHPADERRPRRSARRLGRARPDAAGPHGREALFPLPSPSPPGAAARGRAGDAPAEGGGAAGGGPGARARGRGARRAAGLPEPVVRPRRGRVGRLREPEEAPAGRVCRGDEAH